MRALFPILLIAFAGFLETGRAKVDFVHEVVPILKQHCTECHGGEESEGGFSMNNRELFLDDDTATPGDAKDSYFLQLIQDPDPLYQMPPEEKDRVPAEHVAVLKRWVEAGMPWEPGFTFGEQSYEPPLKPRRPDLPTVTDGHAHPVDRFIDHYLEENDLPRPEPIDDATFLRRVHLDLVGLLPKPEEVKAFVRDDDPDKRAKRIDELLARDIDYADHWLTFWNDLLRNDYAGTGFITGGRTQISRWLYDSLKRNKPFDQFVEELIAPPTDASVGFIDGIKWRGAVSAAQALPVQFSQNVSQSLMGINMKCASCHDSFIDHWTLDDAYGLAAIYAEEPLEMHRCDKPTGETAEASWLFPQLGRIDPDQPKEKRLQRLAELMTHPENGRVTRTIVNRLWGRLMGRGLVHPLDAMQTRPWHEELLDWLAADFQEHGYDLRHTLARITKSAAYQSRVESRDSASDSEGYVYAGPRAKRLTAEQFLDNVWRLTGAAPATMDAPVVRAVADEKEAERLDRPSSWIWAPTDESGPPAAGAEVVLRRDFEPTGKVRAAGLVVTADNAFDLYLNRKKIAGDDDWTRLQEVPVTTRLKKDGVNRLLLVARNGGRGPNPAGAFCALRLVYEDGSEEIIATDESWRASTEIPKPEKVRRWKIGKLPWRAAVPVSVSTWSKTIDPEVGSRLAAASADSRRMVRASLMKSDFLMRSLGRPNRDQVVTSRPDQLTTLEAIDLSNNETLAGYLRTGAERLARRDWPSPDALVEHVYLSTLTRRPGEEERTLLRGVLGPDPDAATISDVLWAVVMTPEFLGVR